MTVYVDDFYLQAAGRFGRMKMSHMIADSSAELLNMANDIGLAARWLQKPGTPHEHFDVSLEYRARAVKRGAVEISVRELGQKIADRRAASKVNA